MAKMQLGRRGFFTGFIAFLGGVFLIRSVQGKSGMTPETTEGPFYPRPSMRFSDTDNDLVKIAGRVQQAGGEVIILMGSIKNRNGEPLAGHRIEIWQCDLNGKYMHPGDDRDLVHDAGFQGFGHDITDEWGKYRFRTIKPTSYPGRTPHIHVKILDGKTELLTTQFYINDHPENRGDFLYNSMSVSEAESVSMTFKEGQGELETVVDIVI